MIVIGLIANRLIKDETDFLLAGRKIGLFFLIFTLAATHFGGGFVTGGIEYGLLHGFSGGLWYGLGCGIGLILLSFFAPYLRELSLFTAPEYLGKRYNSRFVRLYATLTSLIAIIGILSAQIIATRSLLSLFGVAPVTASIIAAIVFITYTCLGGMWAVTLTDFIQLSISIICVIILAIYSYDGISSIDIKIDNVEYLSPLAIVGIILPTIMYTLIGQDFYQRLFSAKNKDVAKKSAMFAGLLLCVLSIFPAMIGVAMFGHGTGLSEALNSFITLIPSALGVIFILTLLGAIMSTADSLLSAASSHIIKDILECMFGIKKRGLLLARLSVIAIGFFALLLSFMLPTIIDALVFSYTIYTAAIFFPLILGILWKGGKKEGAVFSMLISTTIVIFGYFFDFYNIPLEIFGSLVSILSYTVVSILHA